MSIKNDLNDNVGTHIHFYDKDAKNIHDHVRKKNNVVPLFSDHSRITYFQSVLDLIREVNIDNITQDTAYFHAITHGEDICPKDVDSINKYLNENMFFIKRDIALSIISHLNDICDAFIHRPDKWQDNGNTVALTEQTHKKIVELVCYYNHGSVKYSDNDLYLKYLTLRDDSKLANKRFVSLLNKSMISGHDNLFKHVMNLNSIIDVFLKMVPTYGKVYDLEKDSVKVIDECNKYKLRSSILVLETLLNLVDYTKSIQYNELFNKRLITTDYGYTGRMDTWINNNDVVSKAHNWISTIPCIDPECSILIDSVSKYNNILKTPNPCRADGVEVKYLTLLYLALQVY